MEGFDFEPGKIGSNGLATFGNDSALHFLWKIAAVRHSQRSIEEGRDIFIDVECCEIHYPGMKNVLIKHFNPQKPTYKEEVKAFFRQHPKAHEIYRLWKEDAAELTVGTPIKNWAVLSESEKAEFIALGLHSVEQVAAASDVTCQALGMKGREYRTRAQAYIATAKESAAAQQYATENLRLREDIELLQQRVAKLGVPEIDAPKKRGRPRKEQPDIEDVEDNEGNK